MLQGQRLTRRSESDRTRVRAQKIGIFLQSGNLFEHLSVQDNLRLAQRLAGRVNEDSLQALLGKFGLEDRKSARPIHISGGEAARAGLAAALVNEPVLLVADEPTGEVDAATEQILIESLLAYRQRGGTLILATHSDALASIADRIVRLLDGKMQDD
jgi:putative ABC transport system ATP-binding protein